MDHCDTLKADLGVLSEVTEDDNAPSSFVVATAPGSKSMYSLAYNSEITRWFCELLRCVNIHPPTEKGTCEVCEELREYIANKCHNSFLDGECFKIHRFHITRKDGYESKVPHVDFYIKAPDRKQRFIVSHYNPKGVYYRVFSYKEG